MPHFLNLKSPSFCSSCAWAWLCVCECVDHLKAGTEAITPSDKQIMHSEWSAAGSGNVFQHDSSYSQLYCLHSHYGANVCVCVSVQCVCVCVCVWVGERERKTKGCGGANDVCVCARSRMLTVSECSERLIVWAPMANKHSLHNRSVTPEDVTYQGQCECVCEYVFSDEYWKTNRACTSGSSVGANCTCFRTICLFASESNSFGLHLSLNCSNW